MTYNSYKKCPVNNLALHSSIKLKGETMLKLNIVIEKDVDGYYAYCPELKGCHSQGNTHDETVINIREAIELYLETFDEEELNALKSREIYNEIQEFEYV